MVVGDDERRAARFGDSFDDFAQLCRRLNAASLDVFFNRVNRAFADRSNPLNSFWLGGSAFRLPVLTRLSRFGEVIRRAYQENLGLFQYA